MTGTTSCLKPDLRLVVDTQVLKLAGQQEMHGRIGDELRLMHAIRDICSKVVLSRPLVNELVPRFNIEVGRPLNRMHFMMDLDELDKVDRPTRSKIGPGRVGGKAVAFFVEIRSKSDIHLYETARRYGQVVITADSRLLRAQRELEKLTGVRTLSVAEAVSGSTGS